MITIVANNVLLTTWVLAFTAALVIGLSKAGIKGIAIVNVTLMAIAFDAKESTGIVVPLLLFGDLFAVIYYNRHTKWKYIVQFLPWMLLGLLLGMLLGNRLDEVTFKIGMAVIILISVVMMFWWDKRKSKKVPKHWLYAGAVGTIAGITTMIGNLGGAFSNLYFLAMRIPKNEFIGTAAWLFLIINTIKLPIHIFEWGTITKETLIFDLKLIPGIILGILLGIKIVKLIREDFYRKMILILTALGAVVILFK